VQRAGCRGQRAEGRGQRAVGRGQRAEGRGQGAEGRGQGAEGRGQGAVGRGQWAEEPLVTRSLQRHRSGRQSGGLEVRAPHRQRPGVGRGGVDRVSDKVSDKEAPCPPTWPWERGIHPAGLSDWPTPSGGSRSDRWPGGLKSAHRHRLSALSVGVDKVSDKVSDKEAPCQLPPAHCTLPSAPRPLPPALPARNSAQPSAVFSDDPCS
jgi:hypothetical protein